MKAFLIRSTTLLALATSLIAHFALPAKADSTANLLLNLQCQGGYNVNIWKTKQSGTLEVYKNNAIQQQYACTKR